jgi:hypothetical protein
MSIIKNDNEIDRIFNFYKNWFDKVDVNKLTPIKSRNLIAKYEKDNPMVTIVIGANKSGMSSISERPIYMSRAVYNDGTRKSPTTSATLYDVGNMMIGSDGFLWEIAEDKNGKKRWQIMKDVIRKQSINVLKELPIDMFPNDTLNPIYKLPLSVLKKNEELLEESLGYFDVNTDDYNEIKRSLDAVKVYLKYYPNIDLNS